MRIEQEERIGPGDDLGTVIRWEVGEESVDLFTSHELKITVDRDDLTAIRAALIELENRGHP